jgi:hypothetical protein
LHSDATQRGDEIGGTLYIDYADESVKEVTLIPALEHRGVIIVWDVVEGRERGDLSKGDVVMGAC